MEKRSSRWLTLGGGIVVLFVASLAILLKVIPEPHRNLDYLEPLAELKQEWHFVF